jgi:hypothetical protein
MLYMRKGSHTIKDCYSLMKNEDACSMEKMIRTYFVSDGSRIDRISRLLLPYSKEHLVFAGCRSRTTKRIKSEVFRVRIT